MKHPHEILGVDREADLEAIKRAYLQRAKTAHPDAGGSKQDFVRLQAAYEAMLSGYRSPEPEPAAEAAPPAQNDPQPDPDWQSANKTAKTSYEEIVQAVRARMDHDLRRSASDDWQFSPTGDLWWAVLLTAICGTAFATWLSYDGQSFDPSLWSFACVAAMSILVCFCGLAAIAGATPLTSSWTVYRRLMVFFVVLSLLVLAPHLRGTPPQRRAPILSREHVPDWWPVSRRRALRNEWARTESSSGQASSVSGRTLVNQPFFQRMLQPFTSVPKVPRPSPGR